jgi:hypothetical protein
VEILRQDVGGTVLRPSGSLPAELDTAPLESLRLSQVKRVAIEERLDNIKRARAVVKP